MEKKVKQKLINGEQIQNYLIISNISHRFAVHAENEFKRNYFQQKKLLTAHQCTTI